MIIFLLLNIIAVWIAFLIVYKVLKVKGVADSLSALFIIYFAQIVLMELALGIAGALSLKNVAIFTSTVLIKLIRAFCPVNLAREFVFICKKKLS